jgi:hypothetical protein
MKEEMQARIHSIRSELENTNQRTQNLRKELTETIEKAQVELHIAEVALEAQANRKDNRKETIFCQKTTEARLECEKPTSAGMKICQETTASQEATENEHDPGKRQSMEEHQEIPKGEASVMPVRELRKWHRVRSLAAERRQKRKERTQENRGSRRKSAASCRKVTRHAKVAWYKRNLVRKIQIQENYEPWKRWIVTGRKTTSRATVAWRSENVVRKNGTRGQAKRGTPKRRKEGGRPWKCLEYSNGIRSHVEEQIHLRKGRKTAKSIGGRRRHQQRLESMGNGNKVISKTTRLEIAKRIARSTVGMWKIRNWSLWKG